MYSIFFVWFSRVVFMLGCFSFVKNLNILIVALQLIIIQSLKMYFEYFSFFTSFASFAVYVLESNKFNFAEMKKSTWNIQILFRILAFDARVLQIQSNLPRNFISKFKSAQNKVYKTYVKMCAWDVRPAFPIYFFSYKNLHTSNKMVTIINVAIVSRLNLWSR